MPSKPAMTSAAPNVIVLPLSGAARRLNRWVLRQDWRRWGLLLAALLIYLPGIGWGVPHANSETGVHGWDVDSIVGLPVLAELHNLLIDPKPDWYTAYPPFHYLVLGAVYLPYLGFLFLTGGLSSPTPVYPYGLADPLTGVAVLVLLGRMVTVSMASGIVLIAYEIGRTLWDRTAGLLAGLLVMVMNPMLYYARVGNLDIPVLFWTALGLLIVVRSLTFGLTVRRAILVGLLAALSVATKDQVYSIWIPAILVLMVIHLHREGPSQGSLARWRAPAAIVLSGAVTYLAAGGVVLSPYRFIAHIRYLTDWQNSFYSVAGFYTLKPATPATYSHLLSDIAQNAAEALGIVMLTAGLLGIALMWRRETFTRVAVILCVTYIVFTILLVRDMGYRYILFVAFILSLFAARAITLGLRQRTPLRYAVAAAAVVGFGWQLFTGYDLSYQMIRDARYQVSAWLEARHDEDDVVAYFGSIMQLPPLPDDVTVRRLPEDVSAADVLTRERPEYVLVSADWTSFFSPDWSDETGLDRSGFMPAAVYRALQDGSLGYTRLARFETSSLRGRPLRYMPWVNPVVQVFGPIRAAVETAHVVGGNAP